MNIRTLAATLVIATGIAATAGILAYSPSAPAAVRTNEGFVEKPIISPDMDMLFRRHGAAEACREATWPHVPAACIRNADPERLARPVRIIPIHGLVQSN